MKVFLRISQSAAIFLGTALPKTGVNTFAVRLSPLGENSTHKPNDGVDIFAGSSSDNLQRTNTHGGLFLGALLVVLEPLKIRLARHLLLDRLLRHLPVRLPQLVLQHLLRESEQHTDQSGSLFGINLAQKHHDTLPLDCCEGVCVKSHKTIGNLLCQTTQGIMTLRIARPKKKQPTPGEIRG